MLPEQEVAVSWLERYRDIWAQIATGGWGGLEIQKMRNLNRGCSEEALHAVEDALSVAKMHGGYRDAESWLTDPSVPNHLAVIDEAIARIKHDQRGEYLAYVER